MEEPQEVKPDENIDSVLEYFDSLELENSRWKMWSQECYKEYKNQCMKLKKEVLALKAELEAVRQENELVKNENKALKDMKLCKICMDRDSCVRLAPCGHCMSCWNCSKSLKNCPICRKPIKGMEKTFLN